MSTDSQILPEGIDQIWRNLQSSGDSVEALGRYHILLTPGESVCFIPRGKAISTDSASVQLAQFASLLETALLEKQERKMLEAVCKAMRAAEELLESGSRRAFPSDAGDSVQVKIKIRGATQAGGNTTILNRYYIVPSDLSAGMLVCGIARGYRNLLQDAKQDKRLRSPEVASSDFRHAILYQVVRTDVLKDGMQVWEAQVAHDTNVSTAARRH